VLHDDDNYAPPEDVFAPENSERVVWGYPLDLADWTSYRDAHRPWRNPGETQAAYVARVGPFYPDFTPEEIAGWFASASTLPA
jgi:hypothetical protein